MTVTLKDLKELVDNAIYKYGEEARIMFRMKNGEQFDTGWYEYFDSVSVNEEASFNGKDAKIGIGRCFIEIKPIGY